MMEKLGMAEAKRRFSELINRVADSGDRVLIERQGKPVIALVKADDLEQLERAVQSKPPKGLLAAVGAWADYPNLDELINHIYRARSRAKDRKASFG